MCGWATVQGPTFAGFGYHHTAGTRTMLILGGLDSIAFGLVLFTNHKSER